MEGYVPKAPGANLISSSAYVSPDYFRAMGIPLLRGRSFAPTDYDVATMEQRLHDSLAPRRLAMSLLVTFAACALALAVVGVYGVIAYWVGQRTRDIGIRIALGADAARIATMIAREFMGIVTAGLLSGALAAVLLTRVLSSMLFGVSAPTQRPSRSWPWPSPL